MDFNTLANGIYANINTAVLISKDGSMKTVGRDEFLQEAERAWNEGAAKRAEDKLYAGSETRAVLTDTEIAVLRNKYDVRNMSDEQYDAFLDDLEDMGVISQWEKELLGYNGNVVVAYEDENGETVYSDPGFWAAVLPEGSSRPAFRREEADGDLLKWVSDRLSFWKPVGATEEQRKAQQQDLELFEVLSGVLSRMTGTQPVKAQQSDASEDEEPDIIDQIKDPDSAFYQDMYQRLKLQLELSEEQKKEQAIIDTLDAILEGMRSSDRPDKRTDAVTSMAGLSKQISELDEEDPRKAQLELFRQQLNHMGIYMDLGEGIYGGTKKDELTLTQQLIREKTEGFDPGAFDLY